MKKELTFGAQLAEVSVILAIASLPIIIISSVFTTGKIVVDWQLGIIIFFVTTPITIFAGLYGKKNASTKQKKSGWIMFLSGIISSPLGQPFAGVALIIAGIHTILVKNK